MTAIPGVPREMRTVAGEHHRGGRTLTAVPRSSLGVGAGRYKSGSLVVTELKCK